MKPLLSGTAAVAFVIAAGWSPRHAGPAIRATAAPTIREAARRMGLAWPSMRGERPAVVQRLGLVVIEK